MSDIVLINEDGVLRVEVRGIAIEGAIVSMRADVTTIPDCDHPHDPAYTQYAVRAQWVDIRLPLSAVLIRESVQR